VSVQPPFSLIAELTWRCPLRCAYCSNPVTWRGPGRELDTATWLRVVDEAAELGVLQLNLTGGEPLLRDDLDAIVARARTRELYTHLATSGLGLDEARVHALRDVGLDSVQLSIQGLTGATARRVAGVDALDRKRTAARAVVAAGLPLTLNVVLHRENIEELPALVELAVELGAHRVELANVQVLGWALVNRAVLVPTGAQIEVARAQAREARARLRGTLDVVFVLPDQHAGVPRACMGGWGRTTLVVSPDGLVLPCPAAGVLPLRFDCVGERPLAELWAGSEALGAYRGEGWMPEPCRTCDQRHVDHGGCRCQAFALTGDAAATDPACARSPHHARVVEARPASDTRGGPLTPRTVPRITG
jgi:pyrroloquinoline quinone biosynthesis protein E